MNNLSCFILSYTESLGSHPDKVSIDDDAKVPASSIKGHGGRRGEGMWKNGFDAEKTLLDKCNKRLTAYN